MIRTQTDTKEGKYIYGIIRSDTAKEYGRVGIGEREDLVYTINYKDIGAIVSRSPVVQYQARRAELIAHEKVLEEAMKYFTILPVRFSTITESDDDSSIVKILERDYKKFCDLLESIKGKKELGVKVIAQSEEIFYKYILEKNEDIRILKEKIQKLPADKAQFHLMKIGEMVSVALNREKEILKNIILDKLKPLSEDVKINDNYGDMMILNSAYLVKNERESEFDIAVKELDSINSDILKFKYFGVLPPYNFVNLVINLEGA
jgi:Gas vesicle synthesis protein GvpL/GvpF